MPSVAKRKIGPCKLPLEEYAEELEFELELGRLYRDDELPAAAASLRHQVTESPDDADR